MINNNLAMTHIQVGARPRSSLMGWLTELKICGKEDVESALKLLRNQDPQVQKEHLDLNHVLNAGQISDLDNSDDL